MHLPSAGMIRFRFDGFAFASQPTVRKPAAPRGNGEDMVLLAGCKGRSAGALSDSGHGLMQRPKREHVNVIQHFWPYLSRNDLG